MLQLTFQKKGPQMSQHVLEPNCHVSSKNESILADCIDKKPVRLRGRQSKRQARDHPSSRGLPMLSLHK